MVIVTFLFTCQFLFSQIAINEFMASNDTTISDPEGEFDDWIELALASPLPQPGLKLIPIWDLRPTDVA